MQKDTRHLEEIEIDNSPLVRRRGSGENDKLDIQVLRDLSPGLSQVRVEQLAEVA